MSKLANIVADFRTSLATKISAGGTTGTLQGYTDDDGVVLPTDRYFFTIDGDNSQKEHISCTLTGTAMTAIKSISRQGVETSGTVRDHRAGASVVITNFAHIRYLNDMLRGDLDLDDTDLTNIKSISVTEDPLVGEVEKLATVNYVNGVAVAGAPDMAVAVKGIAEEATEAEIDADTGAGGTGARLAVNPSTLATSKYGTQLPSADEKAALIGSSGTPSTSNKYITNDDTASAATASKVARRNATGDVTVPTTPTADTDAASKIYVNSVGIKKVSVSPTAVTLTNSDVETNLFSTTIAANFLGTSNAVEFIIPVTDLDFASDGRTLTLKLKYGSTTISTITVTTSGTANTNHKGTITGYLIANGASAQVGGIKLDAGEDAFLTGASSWDGVYYNSFGTGSEDSTGALALSVTAKWNSATTDLNLVTGGSIVKLIR